MLRSQMFEALHPWLARLDHSVFPSLSAYNALLAECAPPIATESGMPLRFVAQGRGKQPFEAQYEPRCFLRGEVQTREHNLHDLFNALVWLTFPRAKAAINTQHYKALLESAESGGARGGRRDMLTLLDESGVVVACCDPELRELLRDFQWKALFWERREKVRKAMGFYLFGHGLYEKALRPYIGITGQGLLLDVPCAFFTWPLGQRLSYLDEHLATHLAASARWQDTRVFNPVPLLGVPGWWAENDAPIFYENYSYFRPGRLSSSSKITKL